LHQAVGASGALHRALESIIEIKAHLSGYVMPADGLGDVGDCLGELAIRSRALVVADQLARLRDALRDPAVRARTAGWFVRRFQHIDNVASFVQDELQRVHSVWTPYRPRPATDGGNPTDRLEVYRYRVTVHLAQQALEEVASEPDLAHFLNCAASALDCPELRSASKTMLTALAIRIDVGPTYALKEQTSTPKSAPREGGSGKRGGAILYVLRRVCVAIFAPMRAIARGALSVRSRPRPPADAETTAITRPSRAKGRGH
jgi:hypothetical protein